MSTKASKDEVITGRISRETRRRLDALSEATERSRSFLVSEAIESYVSLQEWQVEGIKQAMASVRAGRTIPHAKVMQMVEKYRSKR